MTEIRRGRKHDDGPVEHGTSETFGQLNAQLSPLLAEFITAFHEIDEAGGMMVAYRGQLPLPVWVVPPARRPGWALFGEDTPA